MLFTHCAVYLLVGGPGIPIAVLSSSLPTPVSSASPGCNKKRAWAPPSLAELHGASLWLLLLFVHSWETCWCKEDVPCLSLKPSIPPPICLLSCPPLPAPQHPPGTWHSSPGRSSVCSSPSLERWGLTVTCWDVDGSWLRSHAASLVYCKDTDEGCAVPGMPRNAATVASG